MDIKRYIGPDLLDRFEFHSYGHAIEILSESFPEEWTDITEALRALRLTRADITAAGGNETAIPKKFDDVLYPRGWREIRIAGDLTVKKYPRQTAQRRVRRPLYVVGVSSAAISARVIYGAERAVTSVSGPSAETTARKRRPLLRTVCGRTVCAW